MVKKEADATHMAEEEKIRNSKALAKGIAIACCRNTNLERIHIGKHVHSETGDYSDVTIVTPSGTIPWNEASRISDREMEIFNRWLYDSLYTVFMRYDDPAFEAALKQQGADFAKYWDEPNFWPNYLVKTLGAPNFKDQYPKENNVLTEIPDASTVVLKRWIPATKERLWPYLTDTAYLSSWLATGDINAAFPGGADYRLHQNGNHAPLSAGDITGTVTHARAPHRLSCSWSHTANSRYTIAPGKMSEVTFDLAYSYLRPASDLLLTITHNEVETKALAQTLAGWHVHTDILLARITGNKLQDFTTAFDKLLPKYDKQGTYCLEGLDAKKRAAFTTLFQAQTLLAYQRHRPNLHHQYNPRVPG